MPPSTTPRCKTRQPRVAVSRPGHFCATFCPICPREGETHLARTPKLQYTGERKNNPMQPKRHMPLFRWKLQRKRHSAWARKENPMTFRKRRILAALLALALCLSLLPMSALAAEADALGETGPEEAVCTCTAPCTEGGMNTACPVCGAEGLRPIPAPGQRRSEDPAPD